MDSTLKQSRTRESILSTTKIQMAGNEGSDGIVGGKPRETPRFLLQRTSETNQGTMLNVMGQVDHWNFMRQRRAW